MTIDKDKLEGLRSLLKKAYIEGYQQGQQDQNMYFPFPPPVEERWEQSSFPVYLEIVEKGYEV